MTPIWDSNRTNICHRVVPCINLKKYRILSPSYCSPITPPNQIAQNGPVSDSLYYCHTPGTSSSRKNALKTPAQHLHLAARRTTRIAHQSVSNIACFVPLSGRGAIQCTAGLPGTGGSWHAAERGHVLRSYLSTGQSTPAG